MKKLLILALFSLTLCACAFSEGERNGVVTKLSKKGWTPITKTWEGELILGNAAVVSNASVWKFSVADEDTAKKIETAARGGNVITLQYKQIKPRWATITETDYHVTSVIAKP